ncbi:MAG: hypothetical protein AAB223_09820 [Pseudomonadota bacterium]
MRRLMTIMALAASAGASGCGLEPYVRGGEGDPRIVKGEAALYCYRALVGVDCYKTPNHRDERRLLAYTGPAPETYPKPAPPPEPQLYAPEMVPYYVKDAEPIPTSPPRARTRQKQ